MTGEPRKPAGEYAASREAERDDRRAAHIRQENARLRTQVNRLETEVEELGRLAAFSRMVDAADPEPPKWLSPAKPKDSHATVMLLLSDTHFDEVVRAEEVDGLNAYDRTIATLRLERWARNVVKLARHYLSGVTYDGCVLMLGGDTFSGSIHDELRETNADTLFGSLLYWIEQVAAAIDVLASEFGKVHVVAVPGNHGRQSRKPRSKLRARDNLDWLLAKLLERQFAGDRRVSFRVGDAADAWFTVYGRGQLLTHGDQAHGGGGIGGIWPPIMRLRARKQTLHMETGKPFDTLWMGHWHQLVFGPGLIVNGALKGLDEFARTMNFGFEPPQQAMALVTPEHGLTFQVPVHCADRRRERW